MLGRDTMVNTHIFYISSHYARRWRMLAGKSRWRSWCK